MDMLLLRALSRPCTWATSVESVRRTTTLGEFAVFRKICEPLRPSITPFILVCAWTIVLDNPASMSAKDNPETIPKTLFRIIVSPPLRATYVSREHSGRPQRQLKGSSKDAQLDEIPVTPDQLSSALRFVIEWSATRPFVESSPFLGVGPEQAVIRSEQRCGGRPSVR